MTMPIGPNAASQPPAEICGPSANRLSHRLTNCTLVTVPTSVVIPPMLADQAMPSISEIPNGPNGPFRSILFLSSADFWSVRVLSASCSETTSATAIGVIKSVDAVLLIHIERNAVATMNPRITFRRLVPRTRTMCNAIR